MIKEEKSSFEVGIKGGPNLNRDILSFIDKYVKEIKDNSAAMFIGAGFSKSAGYVDWKNLLRNVAEDLDLDIDKEYDLVSLAQYCYNKNGNRSIINDVIFDEFTKEKDVDENHRIIARLPISTYWTTNYDSLIEDALIEEKRVVDVKYNNKQLSLTKPHRDAIVYKMHGDRSNPDEAILIKDDYEKYYRDHAQFITALSGDLISKTFLFVGFSFSDPNIDYILSRVRIDYGNQNNRQHYAIMRKVNTNDYEDRAEYEYAKRKHEFFVEDLKIERRMLSMAASSSAVGDGSIAFRRCLIHGKLPPLSANDLVLEVFAFDLAAYLDFRRQQGQRHGVQFVAFNVGAAEVDVIAVKAHDFIIPGTNRKNSFLILQFSSPGRGAPRHARVCGMER